MAGASWFNTPLGAPQSVLLRHNENHDGDADGGCSAPTARHVVHRPSCAGTSRARLRRRFFCPQVHGGQLLRTSSRSHSRDGPVPNWQRQTNLWRKATSPCEAGKATKKQNRIGYSDEKMCPMSRKTRIRCPLPQCVERSLVGSCGLLFDSLRGAS